LINYMVVLGRTGSGEQMKLYRFHSALYRVTASANCSSPVVDRIDAVQPQDLFDDDGGPVGQITNRYLDQYQDGKVNVERSVLPLGQPEQIPEDCLNMAMNDLNERAHVYYQDLMRDRPDEELSMVNFWAERYADGWELFSIESYYEPTAWR